MEDTRTSAYKNTLLERKTKAVANSINNQFITSVDVLLALYSNQDMPAVVLQRSGFNHDKINKYHHKSYDESYEGKYVISDFAKVLLNTNDNGEALTSIMKNKDCVANIALEAIGASGYILNIYSDNAYYNKEGNFIEARNVRIRYSKTEAQSSRKNESNKAPATRINRDAKSNKPNNTKNSRNSNTYDTKFNLENLKANLFNNIIGQDNAINIVTSTVLNAMVGLADETAPLSKFLFCGPTGVGKTELAKVLADSIGYKLIKIDMSEYQEKVSITKLIGAAPGYSGYEMGGQLTTAIEANPKSVIIFDEIEKAHPDVYNLFLQLLDEGRLTDNKGKTHDFTQSIVIFTSNVGATASDDGKEDIDKRYQDAIKSTFKAEFINRLDDLIIFKNLDTESINRIVSKELDVLSARLNAKQGIRLVYSQDFIKEFVDNNMEFINFEYGAREIKRLIKKKIGTKLSEGIYDNSIRNGNKVELNNSEKGYSILT